MNFQTPLTFFEVFSVIYYIIRIIWRYVMKKWLIACVTVLLLCGVFLSGCSKDETLLPGLR